MSRLGLLRERNFALLFTGQASSWFGDRMVTIAWAFAVLSLGGDARDIGLVMAAWMGPMAVCLLAGGVVADRLPRRTVMVAADLVRLASQALVAGLLIAGVAEIWMLAASAVVVGAASGFFNPASTGLMPLVVGAERVQDANGLRAIGQGVAEIGGPVVGGLLIAGVGPGYALAVDAATFAVSAACLTALRMPAHVPPVAQSFVADLRDGWSAFVSRRWVWSFVAGALVGNGCWAAWGTLGPVVAERDLGGADTWGVVLGVFGVGSLLGGVAALAWRPRRPIVVATLAVGLFCLPIGVLASGAPVVVLACATFAAGIGLMLSNTLWESTLQRHVPAETLSRVSAYDWVGSLAAYPIGAALWGPIAAGVGIQSALWIAFALQLGTALCVLTVREVRELGPYPEPDSVRA